MALIRLLNEVIIYCIPKKNQVMKEQVGMESISESVFCDY